MAARRRGELDLERLEQRRVGRQLGRVLGAYPTARNKAELRDQLETVYRVRHDYNTLNRPPHPYGFGRLDAFGRIVNALLVTGLGVIDESQKKAPDAPVSFPLATFT